MKPLHPTLAALALFSGRDLPVFEGLKVRWHVSKCSSCREQILLFRDGARQIRESAESEGVPGTELNWLRLEREMLGNIGVGVAAGRCIENVGRKRHLSHAGWLVLGLGGLFVLAWFTHIPPEVNARLWATLRGSLVRKPIAQGTELKATADGIAVRTQGATLTLMHPQSAVVSLAGSSAVTARYVDEETGQVTITKVYAQ
jgi:hypothetical protein